MLRFLTKQSVFAIVLMLAMVAAAIYGIFFKLPPESADTFTGEYGLVLEDYNGNEVALAEFKRELLVVHTWASWCTYCGEELKNLTQLKDKYGEQVTILAVNRAEPESDARQYFESLQIPPEKVQLLQDADDAFYKSIGGYAMPETIFINVRGEIIHHQRGPMKIGEVTEKIDALLAL